MAQTIKDKVNNLVELNFIQRSETEELLEILDRSDFNPYSYILFQNEYKRSFKHYYSNWNPVIWDYSEISKEQQDNCNIELTTFLNSLYASKLVSEKHYKNQQNRINNASYFHKIQLLQNLTEQQAYETWINPQRILHYSNQLLENELISDTSYNSIQSNLDKGLFSSHNQLFNYLKNAKYFDLAKYSDNPQVYLEEIHREVSTILPELSFSDFKYEIVVDSAWSDSEHISQNVIVSFKADGKTYKQKSFIAPDFFDAKRSYLGKIDDQEFYGIFNKILSDKHSPLRLHRFGGGRNDYSENIAHRYFGIIALQKSQTEMFRFSNGFIPLSYESFRSQLTTSKIEEAIREFKELGLFSHLNNLQIEKAKEKVNENENNNLNNVLFSFPEIIYNFDTELSNIDNPYEELIREYGKITHGDFNPENITDDFDIEKGERATLSFTFKGKPYSKQFKISNDWIDLDFLEFTKIICAENNLKGQFYQLYGGGQDASIIYLTLEQYEHIRANKLLVFEDEWQSVED